MLLFASINIYIYIYKRLKLALQSTFQRMFLLESLRESLMRSRTVCSFCFWAISDWVTSATFSFSPSSFSEAQDSRLMLQNLLRIIISNGNETSHFTLGTRWSCFHEEAIASILPKSFCKTCPSYRSSARSLTMILSPTRTSFIQSINTCKVKIKHYLVIAGTWVSISQLQDVFKRWCLKMLEGGNVTFSHSHS